MWFIHFFELLNQFYWLFFVIISCLFLKTTIYWDWEVFFKFLHSSQQAVLSQINKREKFFQVILHWSTSQNDLLSLNLKTLERIPESCTCIFSFMTLINYKHIPFEKRFELFLISYKRFRRYDSNDTYCWTWAII